MKKYKILGYSNPISCNSVPLTTIININNCAYAFFPDLTINKLNISIKSLIKLKNFTPETKDKFISERDYSYMTYDGHVKSGSPSYILEEMKLDLKQISHNKVHHTMLEELIVSEMINLKNQNFNIIKLFEASNRFEKIRFFATTRIKNNREKAKRIFLQIRRNSGFKTVYKKNLHTNSELTDDRIKRFGKPLYNTVINLSKFYREELISNNLMLPA